MLSRRRRPAAVAAGAGLVDRDRLRAAVGRHATARGVTATGLNLTAGPPAYEIAVDPAVIALQSFAHVQPNPFGTTRAFYAGDTGGAIIGRPRRHLRLERPRRPERLGRPARQRHPRAQPGQRRTSSRRSPAGADDSLPRPEPTPTKHRRRPRRAISSPRPRPLPLVPGQAARILPDGTAAAPGDAPAAVKLAIAAANEIHTKPYPEPGAHFGSLASAWPAYDCSGAVSFVLYRAGLHSLWPDVSGTLETWGHPGPGTWITVYANSTPHVDRRRRARV